MSIPKEPRQLMINLMYLVLTALLALNVSAEVMNAFKTIDDSLQSTNNTTTNAIDKQQESLNALLQDESKAKFKPLGDGVKNVRDIISGFMSYVDDIKVKLIDESGNQNGSIDEGDYVYPGTPKEIIKGKKNKDVTTRLMVTGNNGQMTPIGDELEGKIKETRQALIDAYTEVLSDEENAKTFGFRTPAGDVDATAVQQEIDAFVNNISLNIDENWKDKAGKDKNTWAAYRFKQMPVLPVLSLLTTFQADAKNAEALAVSKLSALAGGKEIVFNSFFPVINAKKAYVIKGEKFEAEISLGAYSSDIPPENITLTLNGSRLPVKEDGKAEYSTTANSYGANTLNLKAVVLNPLTGETTEGTSVFEYEVGERSAAVSADKMNVFYIGVDNPVSVSVAGVSSNKIQVSAKGCNIKKSGQGYVVTATKPTPIGSEAAVVVAAEGMPSRSFPFRVKRIPDPVARLSKSSGGAIGNGEFKAQGGVGAFLDNFDFEATCKIQGYNLVYVAKRQDPVEAVNRGARYNDKSKRLVNRAKPGDIYYFDNVKALCPGDPAGRKINSMVFKIK
jgi:gliding motility-associated protein GldM